MLQLKSGQKASIHGTLSFSLTTFKQSLPCTLFFFHLLHPFDLLFSLLSFLFLFSSIPSIDDDRLDSLEMINQYIVATKQERLFHFRLISLLESYKKTILFKDEVLLNK